MWSVGCIGSPSLPSRTPPSWTGAAANGRTGAVTRTQTSGIRTTSAPTSPESPVVRVQSAVDGITNGSAWAHRAVLQGCTVSDETSRPVTVTARQARLTPGCAVAEVRRAAEGVRHEPYAARAASGVAGRAPAVAGQVMDVAGRGVPLTRRAPATARRGACGTRRRACGPRRGMASVRRGGWLACCCPAVARRGVSGVPRETHGVRPAVVTAGDEAHVARPVIVVGAL
jgi:hypothetical protein